MATKREHDKATKENHGERMASDTRRAYRARRGQVQGRDYVSARAAEMASRNVPWIVRLDGFLPALGIASRFRTVAAYRARAGVAMLA